MKSKSTKMYECGACETVFLVAIYRTPKSMPCLREPLHCPFCMSGGNTLTRIHATWPEKKKPSAERKEA